MSKGYRGIKFNVSDITKLRYDSTVAQFNNWLADLKSTFDGDPSKFPTSRQKVILASMTIDEQLQTTYNSAAVAFPAIKSHWPLVSVSPRTLTSSTFACST